MELLSSNIYSKVKRNGKLLMKAVDLLARDMFQSLEILHKYHIILRNLKSENILLSDNGHHVKLVDFRLSKTCKQQLPEQSQLKKLDFQITKF